MEICEVKIVLNISIQKISKFSEEKLETFHTEIPYSQSKAPKFQREVAMFQSSNGMFPLASSNPPPVPSIGQVKSTLRHLKAKKATGSDNIPALFLKRFHEELAPVVHDIICGSIIQCKYPTI